VGGSEEERCGGDRGASPCRTEERDPAEGGQPRSCNRGATRLDSAAPEGKLLTIVRTGAGPIHALARGTTRRHRLCGLRILADTRTQTSAPPSTPGNRRADVRVDPGLD